jgi:hypothetical protein
VFSGKITEFVKVVIAMIEAELDFLRGSSPRNASRAKPAKGPTDSEIVADLPLSCENRTNPCSPLGQIRIESDHTGDGVTCQSDLGLRSSQAFIGGTPSHVSEP